MHGGWCCLEFDADGDLIRPNPLTAAASTVSHLNSVSIRHLSELVANYSMALGARVQVSVREREEAHKAVSVLLHLIDVAVEPPCYSEEHDEEEDEMGSWAAEMPMAQEPWGDWQGQAVRGEIETGGGQTLAYQVEADEWGPALVPTCPREPVKTCMLLSLAPQGRSGEEGNEVEPSVERMNADKASRSGVGVTPHDGSQTSATSSGVDSDSSHDDDEEMWGALGEWATAGESDALARSDEVDREDSGAPHWFSSLGLAEDSPFGRGFTSKADEGFCRTWQQAGGQLSAEERAAGVAELDAWVDAQMQGKTPGLGTLSPTSGFLRVLACERGP